jgi:hypothetical protein
MLGVLSSALFILALSPSIESFTSPLVHHAPFKRRHPRFISISSQETTDLEDINLPRKISTTPPTSDVLLTFVGSKQISSPSAPMSTNLYNFFALPKYRNLLFFQNNVSEVTDVTQSLLDTWDEQAKLGGGTGPSSIVQWIEEDNFNNHKPKEQCQVIQIDAHLHLPGLQVISQSTIGVKLLLQSTFSSLPEYQFTLLDSQLIPSGPAPLVWLFKQLTKYRSTTSSFTRVQVQPIYNDDDDDSTNSSQSSIQFVTEARLETRIRVPSMLVHSLSTRKLEVFEKQGSEAVQRMLETELEPALMKFYKEYCNYISRLASPLVGVDSFS